MRASSPVISLPYAAMYSCAAARVAAVRSTARWSDRGSRIWGRGTECSADANKAHSSQTPKQTRVYCHVAYRYTCRWCVCRCVVALLRQLRPHCVSM